MLAILSGKEEDEKKANFAVIRLQPCWEIRFCTSHGIAWCPAWSWACIHHHLLPPWGKPLVSVLLMQHKSSLHHATAWCDACAGRRKFRTQMPGSSNSSTARNPASKVQRKGNQPVRWQAAISGSGMLAMLQITSVSWEPGMNDQPWGAKGGTCSVKSLCSVMGLLPSA